MSALEDFLAIRRAVTVWQARVDAAVGGLHGLGVSDFATMRCLADAPGHRLRRVDLARQLGLTASGVTRLLGPLERRGIIRSEESGHDARATYAVVTAAGLRLFKEANATMEGLAERVIGPLTGRDRAVIAKLVRTAS